MKKNIYINISKLNNIYEYYFKNEQIGTCTKTNYINDYIDFYIHLKWSFSFDDGGYDVNDYFLEG